MHHTGWRLVIKKRNTNDRFLVIYILREQDACVHFGGWFLKSTHVKMILVPKIDRIGNDLNPLIGFVQVYYAFQFLLNWFL